MIQASYEKAPGCAVGDGPHSTVGPRELRPWPPLRQAWWVYVLALAAIWLFSGALILRLLCTAGYCGSRAERRAIGLDDIGSIPRLFTALLFVAALGLAVVAVRRTNGSVRLWWTLVAALLLALAAAKDLAVHAMAKSVAPTLTLIGSTAVAASVLTVLLVLGRCAAPARPIVVALGCYACAAIGLDAITSSLDMLHGEAGFLGYAGATFVEELGEALTALLVLVAVRWHLPGVASTTPSHGLRAAGACRRTRDPV